LQQLHAFYWNQDFKISLGRGRLPNSLLEIPTLRDDDLLTYTHIRLAGIQLDRQKVELGNDDEWITAIIAGADINLNSDPSKVWSLAVQAIVKNGIDGITQIDNFATQFSVAPSFVYRLGQGIDLLTQVIYTSYDDGLYAGGDDVMFQVGISFSLESVFNDQIHERDSILNLEQ